MDAREPAHTETAISQKAKGIMKVSERQLEDELIDKLAELKYVFRGDIYDRAMLEKNFREKFQALNRVKLEARKRSQVHFHA